MEGWMEGGRDGGMEGWREWMDGWMEGWRDGGMVDGGRGVVGEPLGPTATQLTRRRGRGSVRLTERNALSATDMKAQAEHRVTMRKVGPSLIAISGSQGRHAASSRSGEF